MEPKNNFFVRQLGLWIAVMLVANLLLVSVCACVIFGIPQWPFAGLADTDGLATRPSDLGGGWKTWSSGKILQTVGQDFQPVDMNWHTVMKQEAYSNAVAVARPTVVNITATKIGQAAAVDVSLSAGVRFDAPSDSRAERQVTGSGVIVDARGYILTSGHLVAGTTNIKVIPFGPTGRSYNAYVLKVDKTVDLAIVKMDSSEKFPEAVLGDSSMMEVADVVLAFGSPFGLEYSVTRGIISNNKRTVVIEGNEYKDLIQTDAAINRGNSGGPLVNINGEVVGINIAIYAPTGVFNGIGFVIPINHAKPLLLDVVYSN